jgi:hypothetical protein
LVKKHLDHPEILFNYITIIEAIVVKINIYEQDDVAIVFAYKSPGKSLVNYEMDLVSRIGYSIGEILN